jgi:hypothetical protein
MAKAKTVKKGKKLGSVKPLNSFKSKLPIGG